MKMHASVARLFAPAPRPGRVGAEVELIAVTDGPDPRPADPAVLLAGFDEEFVRAAVPSFEPGGQLELSPPPQDSVPELVDELQRLIARATAIAAARGVRLEAVGVNPWCADVPLRLESPRYLAMQRLFDAVSPDGRRMMRLTASLQVSVDLLAGDAGREQWLVATLAGPPLAAAFDNSAGERTRIWRRADLRRTGYDGRHLDAVDPVGAYTAFASAAPRLPIPEAERPGYHLSTLFPPVRPRGGYLEVRYLDAQPLDRIGEAVATIAALLYDPQARRDALDLLLPRMGDQLQAWREAEAGCSVESVELLAIAQAARATADLAGAA